MKLIAKYSIAILMISGCVPAEPDAYNSPYDRLPVLGRDQLVVRIAPEPATCVGIGDPYPCFTGVTLSGEQISFDAGIEGYTFKTGASDRIAVERIRYDFSAPNAPQDMSSYRYILKTP